MVYGTQITILTGANLNQLITGGPHIAVIDGFFKPPIRTGMHIQDLPNRHRGRIFRIMSIENNFWGSCV